MPKKEEDAMKAVSKSPVVRMSVQGASHFIQYQELTFIMFLYIFPCQHCIYTHCFLVGLLVTDITFTTNCIPSVSLLFPFKLVFLLIRVVGV